MVVDGGVGSASSSCSWWGWLHKILSSSLLKGPSSLLGKPNSANSGSFGWVDGIGFALRVLQYAWGWSSVRPNDCEANKLVKNGVGRSCVKENVVGCHSCTCGWVKSNVDE